MKKVSLLIITLLCVSLFGCSSASDASGDSASSDASSDVVSESEDIESLESLNEESSDALSYETVDELASLIGYQKLEETVYDTEWVNEDSGYYIAPITGAYGYVIANFYDLDSDGEDEFFVLTFDSETVSADDFEDEDLNGGILTAFPGNYYQYTFSVYEFKNSGWVLSDQNFFYSASDYGDGSVKTLYLSENGTIVFHEYFKSSANYSHEDLSAIQVLSYSEEKIERVKLSDSGEKALYRYAYITEDMSSEEYLSVKETAESYGISCNADENDFDDSVYNLSFSFDKGFTEYTVVTYSYLEGEEIVRISF